MPLSVLITLAEETEKKTIIFSVYFGIQSLIYTLIHHRIVRRKKNWNPEFVSAWKAIYFSIATTMALQIPGLLVIIFGKEGYYYNRFSREWSRGLIVPDVIVILALISFFAVAIFLFQFEFVQSRKIANKQEKRKKKQLEKEAIEKELADMKQEVTEARKKKLAGLKRTGWTINKKKKRWPWLK